MPRPAGPSPTASYHLRVMACLAASLVLCLLAVHFWPTAAETPTRQVFDTRGQDRIVMEEVLPTRQSRRPPPPPAPPIPVIVPDEVVLEEIQLDLRDNLLSVEDPGDGEAPVADGGPPNAATRHPQEGPKTVRFVEPEYTREARRRKVRAELVVEVLVDERGRVQETRIVERFLLGKEMADKQPVSELGYGLEEAATSAAQRWIFRPARQDGRPVRSYTTLTFTFGV